MFGLDIWEKIVSWKNHRKEELLFMSSKAIWKQHKPIREGISTCLARVSFISLTGNRMWSLDRDPSPLPPLDNQSFVELILKSTKVDLKTPCSFEFRLRISLNADNLILIPQVRNTANKAFSFSFTLCNYLSVSDIRKKNNIPAAQINIQHSQAFQFQTVGAEFALSF
ncbi:hypothetical protein GLYMA_19G104100v4 [Glycine max]|nr:hypothetical protein GLYMA_19G104100v4 [Glycine max]KAH1077205.1 hypothetical protein GYH30_052636 [Glycine max]